MVKLHVKQGDQSQFLFETTVNTEIDELTKDLVAIYNGRLKVERLCSEIEDLSRSGVALPRNMQGLTAEQVFELKLKDSWSDQHMTEDNFVLHPDLSGKRNGKAPTEKLAEVLSKTTAEAKAKISKKLVDSNMCLTYSDIQDALDMLKGAVMIVYPMGLPVYDPVREELENKEDISGTQASHEVLEEIVTDLWWAGKELQRGKKLHEYIGKNEKSKLIIKLQKKGRGAPGREPVITEEQHKLLMMAQYRRQEELKKLDEVDDDSVFDSVWADNNKLKKSFQGLPDIKYGFR